jgi:hypothetical protein
MRRVVIPQRSERLTGPRQSIMLGNFLDRGSDMKFGQLKRREFITLFAGAAAAWPFAEHAQRSAKPGLGFVSISDREGTLNSIWYPAFMERLSNHGWTPASLSIEYVFAITP